MGIQYDYEKKEVPSCEKEGNYHEYKTYINEVLCSNPPKYRQTCIFCGDTDYIECRTFNLAENKNIYK